MAVINAINPATIIDMIKADPAYPATMPVTTKIPPPTMAPIFIATALHKPIERLSTGAFCSAN
jgi:hypothetical protein